MSLQSGKGTDFCRSCLWPKKIRGHRSERCGSCANKIQVKSKEHLEKLRLSHIGIPRSPETKEKLRIAHLGLYHPPWSEELRAKCLTAFNRPEILERRRLAKLGHKHNAVTRAKMSLARKGKPLSAKQMEARKSQWKRPHILAKVSGPNNCNWRGGFGSEPYISGWSAIRRQIRKRDEHLCQHPNCYIPENGRKHPVHHIDYEKENNTSGNLILLCDKHHNETKRGDKDHWIEYYQAVQGTRGINPCT